MGTTIGVLGVGAMGKLIAEDLFRTFGGSIILLGRDVAKLKAFAKKGNKVTVRKADAANIKSMAAAFGGVDVVIHAVHHEYNLNVMKACLASKSHYVDLGGLFHYTKKQLRLNRKFEKAKLTAVLGMGAAPGITNVLAGYGAQLFDTVTDIEIRLGAYDGSTYKQVSPLSNSYSIQTILEEFSWKPAVFINGKTRFVEPLSGKESYKFPKPVGTQKPQYTIHSEIATLPHTLHAKNVSFKIAFDDDFVNKISMLHNLGFLSDEPLSLKGIIFPIKQFSAAILKRLPPSIVDKTNQYEIIRVVVKGKKTGKNKIVTLDAHVKGINETVDKDTADPASIIAQMIADGTITDRGVFPPESIVPAKLFFKALAKRKIYIFLNGRYKQ